MPPVTRAVHTLHEIVNTSSICISIGQRAHILINKQSSKSTGGQALSCNISHSIHGIPASCGFRSESKLTLIFSLVAALPDHLPCPRSYALTIHPFHLTELKSNKEVKVKIMCLCSRHISTLPPVVLLNIRDGFDFN